MVENEWFKIQEWQPCLSVDCVIISYHKKKIKVLLNKVNSLNKYSLPGGLVYRDEDVDDAARRILSARTGLENIELRQFYCFGKASRTSKEENLAILQAKEDVDDEFIAFFTQRFVSIGYFALVKYDDVIIEERENDIFNWHDIDQLPELYTDHKEIISKAMQTIRMKIDHMPIACRLLSEKFIFPDLQTLYEGILGHHLDKRNFLKKMVTSGLIIRLDERKEVNTYPHPYYYIFNEEKIKEMMLSAESV